MSLVLLEGFDDGNYEDNSFPELVAAPRWTITTTGDPTQTYAATPGTNQVYWYLPASGHHATMIVGVRVWLSGHGTTSWMQVLNDNGAGSHGNAMSITRNVDGSLTARDANNTVIATSDPGVLVEQTSQWHEMKVTSHATAGTIDYKIDGVTIFSLTGLDTLWSSAADTDISAIGFNGLNARWDDLIVCNGDPTAGTGPSDFFGDSKVYTLYPDGNGNYSGLTGSDGNSVNNFQQVDTGDTTDGSSADTDYNGSATPGDKDTYTFDDLPVAAGTILGVEVRARAFKSDAGAISGRILHRRGVTDSPGSDLALATGVKAFRRVLAQDPVAGSAWTITNLNASEFGYEVRS